MGTWSGHWFAPSTRSYHLASRVGKLVARKAVEGTSCKTSLRATALRGVYEGRLLLEGECNNRLHEDVRMLVSLIMINLKGEVRRKTGQKREKRK